MTLMNTIGCARSLHYTTTLISVLVLCEQNTLQRVGCDGCMVRHRPAPDPFPRRHGHTASASRVIVGVLTVASAQWTRAASTTPVEPVQTREQRRPFRSLPRPKL